MKNLISCQWILAFFALVPAASNFAADTNLPPGEPIATVPAVVPPAPIVVQAQTPVVSSVPQEQVVAAPLPRGASEIVKLSRAQVNEDVIVSYVQNSGSTYRLNSDDIVRLRSEGVSARVINVMLENHKKNMDSAQVIAASAPAPAAPVYADNSSAPAQSPQAVEAPLVPTQTQSAPGSSVYVIPYPQATAAYYGYYAYPSYPYLNYGYYGPSYYGYYGGPVVSFGFNFGGGYGHGHSHGYHGGYHHH